MDIFSILTLIASEAKRDELIDYYVRNEVLELSGAKSSQLCTSRENPRILKVIARWNNEEEYLAWQNTPIRATFSAGIAEIAGAEATAKSEIIRLRWEA